MAKRRRLVIVGNGPAGLNALEVIRKRDNECSVTLISNEPVTSYSRLLLPYYLADKIDEASLYVKGKDIFNAANVKMLFGRQAVSLDPSKQRVALDDGTKIAYDALLICTGASARRPKYQNGEGSSWFTSWTLDDVKEIKRRIGEGTKVVVSGSGLLACLCAAALREKGAEVAMVARGSRILRRILDDDAAQIIEAAMVGSGIQIIKNKNVVDVVSGGKRGSKAVLDDGSVLAAQLVVVATGTEPNTKFLMDSGIQLNRGIVVGSTMQTNIENVYAAGDVAEGRDSVSGEPTIFGIWPVAVQQGRIAGANMTGGTMESPGYINLNVLEIFGVTATSVGDVRENGEVQTSVFHDAESGVYRKFFFKDDVLRGTVLIGANRDSGILASLVQRVEHQRNLRSAICKGPCNLADILHGLRNRHPALKGGTIQ